MRALNNSPTRFLLAAAMLLAFGLYVASLTDVLGRGFDDGQYAVLAESLASGHGFSQLSLVGEPPEGRYPFGLPILLVPLWWLPLDPIIRIYAMKIVSVFATLCAALAGFAYLTERGYAGSRTACVIVLFTLFNPLVFLYSREVLSEMVYLTISILALHAMEAYGTEESAFQLRSHIYLDWRLVLSVLAVVSAFYTRSIGISLVVAGLVYYIGQRAGQRAFAFTFGSGLLIIPWFVRNQFTTGSSNVGYLSQFFQRSLDEDLGTITAQDLIQRLVGNVRDYLLGGIPGAVFPSLSPYTWLNLPDELRTYSPVVFLTVILGVLILASFLVSLFFKRRLLDIYFGLYLLICLFWPWEPTRLLVPMIVFLYLYLAQPLVGIMRLFRHHVVSSATLIAGVFVGIYLLGVVYSEVRFIQMARGDTRGLNAEQSRLWQETLETYRWLSQRTTKNAHVAIINDAQAYYYAQRKVVQVLDSPEGMVKDRADYAVLIPAPTMRTGQDLSHLKFDPVKERFPGAFKEEYRSASGRIQVYSINREVLAKTLGMSY